MTESKLTNQVALVTGAGRGIGAAIAERLAALGATVVLGGRKRPPLAEIAARITNAGNRCEVVELDVTSLPSVEAVAHRIGEKFGHLEILVNNAGIGGFAAPLHELSPNAWDEILNTNLRGVYYCLRSLVPMMIRAGKGHVINISSIAGKNALPNGAAYAASKWGLNGLTFSVAEELRAHNIRVSVICPGSTNTELSPHAGKDPNKMLQPDDVAHVVEMLVTQAPQSFASEVILRPTLKP